MEFLTDIFEYDYLLNALIACILSGIACGIVGTYVVARRMVFLSGGITHASFGGVGMALYYGLNPLLGAFAFALLAAFGVEYASSKGRIREDSAIGLMWSVGMAVGVLFMSMRNGYVSGDLSSYLFGSITTVTNSDVYAMALLTLVLLVGASLWLRPVMYVAFDRDYSRSADIPTAVISYVMAAVVAVTIVLSIRIMGIVLLISLLTMPAIISNVFVGSYTKIVPCASLIATFASVMGLVLSYYFEIPSGSAIIFVLTFTLIIVKLLSLHPKKVMFRK